MHRAAPRHPGTGAQQGAGAAQCHACASAHVPAITQPVLYHRPEEAGGHAARGCGRGRQAAGGGHVGIGSEVDVQKRPLRALLPVQFPGAVSDKIGLVQSADGGTLFLDEISELPIALQVKLLHAIEEKEIRAVGAQVSRRVNVRILAATNRDMAQMVSQGGFREDLFYRLNVLQIHLPALRDRPEDSPGLLNYFVALESSRLGLDQRYVIDPTAEEVLVRYSWPGNLRELQNVIARALVLADDGRIQLSDLPDHRSLGDREAIRQLHQHVGSDRLVAVNGAGNEEDRARLFAAHHLHADRKVVVGVHGGHGDVDQPPFAGTYCDPPDFQVRQCPGHAQLLSPRGFFPLR